MTEWLPISEAPKVVGKELLGVRIYVGTMSKEPFITFWSPTLNKFYCDPTHYIEMPAMPPVQP